MIFIFFYIDREEMMEGEASRGTSQWLWFHLGAFNGSNLLDFVKFKLNLLYIRFYILELVQPIQWLRSNMFQTNKKSNPI